ncbi:Ribosomal RNA large subunit methyltransferase L [Ascidiaceihabitans donghaensis]|uniref:Ribosomal RNA large subunit methyltransferase L n=1 Tax=Ascidiaceihabitans donghaensis TaxID=1510460 RepID=A0A2R8B9Q7_9RHOB|nr:RNA methyltransferase [Ascidiaceihabitans donghaensis]SPH19763.1 Ribosomal RNA large subunit methyltransferase L [Ascidiaceihabitans donghaensis]
MDTEFEIFLATAPGLEPVLQAEAESLGFAVSEAVPGGVNIRGSWHDVWRANLLLRGANRVLVRLGSFRVMHLAQLDKRARKFPWADVLRPDVPVKVDVVCKKSRVYHAGAATQRIEKALVEELGATVSKDAELRVMVRIEDDLCTISLDTSGELLHKRGHKEAVGKAPMRETLASLFLRQMGFDGTVPVYDPMCGSGTFVIEAAEMAMGLAAGRARSFGFEQLASFDAAAWTEIKAHHTQLNDVQVQFAGSDRDAGAVRMASANAERAGVAGCASFSMMPFAEASPLDGPTGLVMVNPPYGARIGNKKVLYSVYAGLGDALKTRFKGWRVGMVTSEPGLARASGLPFAKPGAPVAHGGLRVNLFQTGPL